MGLIPKFRLPGELDGEFGELQAEFEQLRVNDAARLARYEQYRAENEVGRDDLQAELDPTTDYGQRLQQSKDVPNRHNIPLPFGQALTVKHAYRVAGRLPEAIVDRRDETPVERQRSDTMEKIWWGVCRESKGESQLSAAAWDGSQVGSACFEVYFSPRKNLPYFRSIDPAGALVLKGVDDPHDFRRFYRFWDVPVWSLKQDYRGKMFRGEPINVDAIGADDKGETVTLMQVADGTRTLRVALGEKPVPLWERVHEYGFVPYVVIPNLGPERDVWGWADYEFIRGIAAYLPKLFSREADILRSVAGGVYMNKRSGNDNSKIAAALAKSGVLDVKRDGDIEPIKAPEVPAMATDHADRALMYLKMLGFAPDASWGDGNAGSGSDRGLQLQPMAELTALKQINWAAGLGRLGSMIFRMIEEKQSGKARYRGIAQRGFKRQSFNLTLDSRAEPLQIENPSPNLGAPETLDVPQSPADIFDGDHEIRFSWLNRTDPEDPAYVMSELNKFQQGIQSARTTLERLGVDNPEDELKLVDQEATLYPWMRQGMIALLKQQLEASSQGEGGGPPVDPGTGLDAALEGMMTREGSAQDANAGATGLGEESVGALYGAK